MRKLIAATALALAAIAGAAPSIARADADSTHYYLSLGDSIAQGYQPIGGSWTPRGFPGYNHGYPDELLKLVREPSGHLQLWKLGCGGETTATMLTGAP